MLPVFHGRGCDFAANNERRVDGSAGLILLPIT
jgi:hypothetical protein